MIDRQHKPRWLLFGVLITGCLMVAAGLRRVLQRQQMPRSESRLEQPPALSPTSSIRLSPLLPAAEADDQESGSLLATRWFRWALFAEVLVALIWLFSNVSPPLSIWIFACLLIVSGLLVTRRRLTPAFQQRLGAAIRGYWHVDRLFIGRLMILSGFAVMIASTQLLQPSSSVWMLPYGGLLLVFGGVMSWIGLMRTGLQLSLPVPAVTYPRPVSWAAAYKIMLAVGVFLLWLMAEINGGILGIAALQGISTDAQFILLCLGVILLVLGLGAGQRINGRLSDWEIGILLLVTLAALILRLWRVDDTIRFFVDELAFSSAILRLWFDPQIKLLEPMEGIAAFPYLFAYLQTFGADVFGRNLIGLRATGAVVGAVTVPALYFLARTLFDRRTAVVAALLLATFPPHLQFSRIAISEIAAPLFGTLALAFLSRGIIHDSRVDYAAGGALLGLTHYFHESGRLFYTPLALVWVAVIFILWRPRLNWGNLAVAGVALALVAAPVYYTLIGLDKPLAARMLNNNSGLAPAYWRDLFVNGGWELHVQQHLLPAFLFYIHRIDQTLFYRGNTALLLPVMFPLFTLGIVYALWRGRTVGAVLLLLWVLGTSLGNSLLVDSAGSPRFIVVLPALMLLVAMGIRYGMGMLLPQGRWAQRLLAALALGLAAFQAVFYFTQHLPLYSEQFRAHWGHPDGQDALLRSLSFPPGTSIQIVSIAAPEESFLQGMLLFFNDDLMVNTLPWQDFDEAYIASLPLGRDYAFYVERDDERSAVLLRRYFDVLPPELSPYDLPPKYQFILYYAPAGPGGAP